jgi:tRNA(fMet)-specific endonuclease VapC
MAKLLLDTNAVIVLFSEDENLMSYVEGNDIYVPVIAIGELLYGAEKSMRREENIQRVYQFAKNRQVLNCTQETATWYEQIMNNLRMKGRPIPQNDVWMRRLPYNMT